jgi:hypothetical protein
MQGESIGPVQFPRSLDEWNYSTVERLVQLHEFEPGQFDYKEVLNRTRGPGSDELLNSIRKTACSMANTDGGFILFGIQDRRVSAADPRDRIIGIPLGGDLRSQFGHKIADIQPDVFFEASPSPIPLPGQTDRGVFVVWIPPSPKRPHMVTSSGIFFRRGAGGSAEIMTAGEVRDQVVYSEERQRKLVLLRIHLAQFEKIASSLYVTCPPGTDRSAPGCRPDVLTLQRFNTAALDALMADAISLLPPSQNFLNALLAVSLAASQTNMVLNRALAAGQGSPWAWARANESLEIVLENCRFCRGELEEMWGPLIPDNESVRQAR